ncbi:TolC family protein [Luteibacter aegosomatissinici]|uniref:TolC family protein n=1 Tax=Luteibacter aegosomatissinici TaxID=2911539 RepID=UPI001FF7D8CA|nr:TolC family protein [Luteibacter aegosomatissinici]UPG94339.1 TolC family protein [Luteibacter aegosomatissinici]
MFPMRAAPFGAVCVFLVASVAASPSPPPVKAAVEALWRDNPQVQAAEANLRAAHERASGAAQPFYNPSLQLEGENADVDRRTAGASLALDVTGKRKARIAESDADVRARTAELALARRDITLDWLKGWTGVALAHDQAALGRRRVELMQAFDALAAQRLKTGDISSPERDLAALALGEALVQQASLDTQEADARAALAITGTANAPNAANAANAQIVTTDLPPAATTIIPLSADERPDLLLARAAQDRADAAVTVADRARRPDPTISVTGGQVRSGPRTDRVIGVSVSMPLPVRDSGRYSVSAARAEADAAYASTRAAALRTDAQLVRAQATYTALRTASETFGKGRAGAFDERARLLEKLWQASEITTSDYLLQLKQSLDTAVSGIALQNQAWQAWFDYLAAAGRLPAWIDGTDKDTSP